MLNGERLKLTRKYKGFTLEELSSRIRATSTSSATKGVVSRWENGKAIPRLETIQLLAEILEVDKEFLLGLNTFGYELKEIRFKNKISMKELANKTAIDEDSLILYEQAFETPTLSELNTIGKALEIDNFHQYLLSKGVKLYLSDHDSTINQLNRNVIELDELLATNTVISYKGRVLTSSEINQIIKMIDVLLINS